jgi:LysM repeat protein
MKTTLHGVGGILLGVLAALVSSGIVLGSFVLALTEGRVPVAWMPSPTATLFTATVAASPTASPPPATLAPGAPTFTPTAIPTATAPPVSAPTATLPPPPPDCPPPPGWIQITTAPGDTLRGLAQTYGTTQEALAEGNCLLISRLAPGSYLYVPAPPTPPPVACGPPAGWVFYTVRPGDTLFGLSLNFGVSVYQLQLANCLVGTNKILAGQRLFVPFAPTQIPSPTSTPTATATPAPTFTLLPPTSQPTPTTVPTLTASPRPPTATAVPSFTPAPSNTPTPTATPSPTSTPTPLPTNSPPTISDIPNQSTSEDTPVGPLPFTIGDPETPAGSLTVSAGTSNEALVPAGNITLAGSGANRSLTILPAPNQFGSASISITVNDADGGATSDTFNLSVSPVNDPPAGGDDAAVTKVDTAVSIAVLGNDVDIDGDPLSIEAVTVPSHGTAAIAGNAIDYSPAPGYTGPDSFTYTVSDGQGGTDIATVTVTIQ